MDILSPKIIKELLSRYSAAPLKRLGQNFLINPGVLKKIIAAADLGGEETVLEIGPGLGTLTQELAKQAKKVIAVEKDKKIVEILKETMNGYKNVEIIEGDILKLNNWPIEQLNNYIIVANLPYYIASPVIRKFLETENPPSEMVLMVQKEVAQRVCAKPPNMSLLSVSVQFYAEPKIISFVSKGSFWPSPKVDSAILRLNPHKKHRDIEISKFFSIVRAGFSSPRKQLIGNLSNRLKLQRHIIEQVLKKAGIGPSQRAETLSLEDWIKISQQLEKLSS